MPPKTKTTPAEETKGYTHLPILRASRRVLLAAVGAAALAQDEIEDFINRLIERGEIAEKDGRKLVDEIIQRRKMKQDKFRDETEKRLGALLAHMDIPTKKDISLLNEKIVALTQKIDAMKKEG